MIPLDPDSNEASEQSLDFSKLPNLQEMYFGLSWESGGLPWIPKALSTARPATSPCLFTIKLSFTRRHTANESVKALINNTGKDLRKVADEVAWIKRDFSGHQ